MKKKVTRQFTYIGIIVTIICTAIVFIVVETFAANEAKEQAKNTAEALASIVNTTEIEYQAIDLTHYENLNFSIIDASGEILFNTLGTIENVKSTPEFASALDSGTGAANRICDTIDKEAYFYTILLDDGNVLRVSITKGSILTHILTAVPVVIILFILIVILSKMSASMVLKKVITPVETIDVKNPLNNDTFEEFTPLLRRINRQNKQLQKRLEQVHNMRNDLAAIMKTMTEGLIVINPEGLIISINQSALNILEHEGDDVIGQPLLALYRDSVFVELANACEKHEKLQAELVIKGRIYRATLSLAKEGGSILMLVDETEKCEAEQMRREFSANVSHELKTPLQSILGYAELLNNNLVNEKDKPNFYNNIYNECRRLISLIQDIIDLSRLDESGGTIAKESINIYSTAQTVASELHDKALKKQVELKVEGKNIKISAVPALLYEMIYNLTDNAITYNKPGGNVTISVVNIGNEVDLIVSDTGIGIPSAHQARVFERFYRVDKSHSRSTGGTGLGLSIVKHAAAVHGAKVSLQSAEGEGTCIKIAFNK